MDQIDTIFMRNFAIVLAILAGLAVVFIILAVHIGSRVDYEDNVAQAAAIAERIAPIGTASTGGQGGGQAAGSGASGAEPGGTVVALAKPQKLSGDQVFQQACFACHGTGAGGAPTLEPAHWGSRLSQGMDTLVSHAIDGYQGDAGIMPPKGGRMDLSDDEISDAVEYMVSQVQ